MEISNLLKLKNIERLSGTFTHRSYNLMEHQYMVAMLFQEFSKQECIEITMDEFEACLKHDMLESITGDLINPVKKLNSITSECWDKIEDEVIQANTEFNDYSDMNIRGKFKNELNYSLFKVCDYLDLWIFCKEEFSVGNHHKDLVKVIYKCQELIGNKFRSVKMFMESYK